MHCGQFLIDFRSVRAVSCVFYVACVDCVEVSHKRAAQYEQQPDNSHKNQVLLFFPVAGASLPVLAFFFLGVYGQNIPMIVSVIILGIGHIGIHLDHEKEAKESK